MLDRFKKQQPSLASTIKIQVVNLEEYQNSAVARSAAEQIMLFHGSQ